ncbi:MAG: dihydroorotase [Saprospiraceae bacterium]
MSSSLLLKNLQIVNEGSIVESDLLIKNNRIEKIARNISDSNAIVIDGQGQYLIPGCIDDQVHFREPGFTHKADIHSESCAAVAGGVTSYMEMPNTFPNALTAEILEEKYALADKKSFANYSFYMGTSNTNTDEVLKIDNKIICGVKIFLGSSTGNMLVDNEKTLAKIFAESESLIAVHCEDEEIIKLNQAEALKKYGTDLSAKFHPIIRSREACYKSSSFAVSLAQKNNTRLHVLHISSAEELNLFLNKVEVNSKRITSEACVHHMYFSDEDYASLGNLIKCNPAIKTSNDRNAILLAIESGRIDVIATDHAPHTLDEKSQEYIKAPAGLPLIQNSLQMVLSIAKERNWDLPFVVQKMAHDVAQCFGIVDRGFIREGYFADLVLLDPNTETQISNDNVYYKCSWTPLAGRKLRGKVLRTFVNGSLVYDGITKPQLIKGMRMNFNRL